MDIEERVDQQFSSLSEKESELSGVSVVRDVEKISELKKEVADIASDLQQVGQEQKVVQEKLQEEIAALTATLQSLIKSKAGMALDDTKNS